MAVTLVTTVGASDANSYVSAEAADTYIEFHILDDDLRGEWAGLPADEKSRYLILATRQLDMYSGWRGVRKTRNQALEWPRADAVDVDGYYIPDDSIPAKIIAATVETAWWMWQNSAETPVEAYQYDSIRVGAVSINFNEKAGGPSKTHLPANVLALISGLGEFNSPAGQGNTIQQARLIRS